MIEPIMRRGSVTTVTINMEEPRNLGTVLMINYMREVCAKTVISMIITNAKGTKKITLSK